MSEITLYHPQSDTVTSVPNRFIDQYMAQANGEYVKVYLYLLRSIAAPKSNLSLSLLADRLDCTERDVLRALKYWEKLQFFSLEYDTQSRLCGIHFQPEEAAPSPAAESAQSPADLADFFSREEVQELVFIAEQYLGRTLNHGDLSALFFWHDELSLSCELIEYLIESCVSKGNRSLRYMQKIAESYASEGIRTVEEAKEHASRNSSVYFAVLKAFGIRDRHLAPAEQAYVTQWNTALGFDAELISEACARTIRSTHSPNFGYANTILKKWHAQGVKTMEDVAAADAEHKKSQEQAKPRRSGKEPAPAANRFINFKQRDNNYEEIQKRLIQNSLQ